MPVQNADMAGKIAEIKAILRSLLISKAGQNINLSQLNGMYRDVEEENIPFRNFGFPSLMDFLQNIPDTVRIIQKNGETCVQHVDTIKSAHVSSLVNRQRKPPAKKRTKASYSYRPTQRYFTPSLNRTAPHYFPNPTLSRNFAPNQHNPVPLQRNPIPPLCPTVPLLPTPAKVSALPSSSLLRQFLIDLKAQTTDCQQGIRKVDVLTRMNSLLSQAKPNNFGLYNIQLLNKHLQDINYMVSVKNDYIYFRDDMINNKENKKPVEQVVPKPNNSNDAYARTTRTDNYAASLDSDDVNEIHETFDSKGSFKHCQNTSESIYENPGASSCKNFNGHQKQDVEESVETQAVKRSDILSQRTKIRLQKLLENHPEGIWCSELPSMYKTDYAVDLEYYEMGFHNITEFVGAFPDIFLLVQPPSTNRQMVLDARKSNNSIKSQQKPTLAAYYNYDCLPNEPEPVPFELSADVRRRLIPENVMNLDETVCSIDVTTVYSESSEDYIEIYFSEIFTPSFFWIHLRKNRKKLASMMEEIHEFYNNQKIETYKVPQAILEVGLNVACTYNRAWHRAVVKKIKPDGFIIVWFYDYGTVKTYHPEELYFLHKRFSSLPAQAIACGLYNMKPINDTEWPNSSTNPFVNKVWGIPLIAIICTINEENNTMMINLTDTSDDQTDLHISDWMVESGYAEYGKMVCIKDKFFSRFRQQCLGKNDLDSNSNKIPRTECTVFSGQPCFNQLKLPSHFKKLDVLANKCDTLYSNSSVSSSPMSEIVYIYKEKEEKKKVSRFQKLFERCKFALSEKQFQTTSTVESDFKKQQNHVKSETSNVQVSEEILSNEYNKIDAFHSENGGHGKMKPIDWSQLLQKRVPPPQVVSRFSRILSVIEKRGY